MARQILNRELGKGVVTIPYDPELIPAGAAQDSLGFLSFDNEIELCRGRLLVGAEETASGYVKGHTWAFKGDGTPIQFRKVNTKIQYYNDTTELWVDVITGLTDSAEYSLNPYQSTAGTFVYATGIDGIFKIHTANPTSYITLYSSTDIYRGKSIISNGRMFMWDLPTSKTGLYGSRKDGMELVSGNYTVVTAEVVGSGDGVDTTFSGTLAFKAGDAKRNCFVPVFTVTGGEVVRDTGIGTLTGNLGATGTINYITGDWAITFVVPPANAVNNITCTYQWEMSNNKGVTDFSYSSTRVPLEGFILNQSEGGDFIQTVIPYDGKFYSLKNRTVYELTIDGTDTTFNNVVFRRNIGLEYWRSAVSTGRGIVFMDTSNLEQPKLTILAKNITGDNLEPQTLCNGFDFSYYRWDACAMDTFGEYIVFSGRSQDSATNNKLFFYNIRKDTVDILPYETKTLAPNAGLLYIGDTITDNVYQILSGFDDDEGTIENYWISKDDTFNTEDLKKVKRFRIKGLITRDQILEIYISYDNDAYTLVGTIRGDGTYVDASETFAIGESGIGLAAIGGDSDILDGYNYYAEIKLSTPKFRKRTIKLQATGIGYVSVNLLNDYDVRLFPARLPAKYRQKQNVSVDGTQTDQ